MWLSESEGMHSLLQIELNSEMSQLMVSAPSNFNNFADMPSAPGAFPSRSCEIASSISSSVMGWDRSSSSACKVVSVQCLVVHRCQPDYLLSSFFTPLQNAQLNVATCLSLDMIVLSLARR